MAPPLVVLQKLFKPLWRPLVSIGRRLDERIAKSGEISVNELSKAVELTDNKDRSVEEKEILERIVKFGDKDAKQIMTPRTDVVAFSLEEPWSVLVLPLLLVDTLGFPFIRDLWMRLWGCYILKI